MSLMRPMQQGPTNREISAAIEARKVDCAECGTRHLPELLHAADCPMCRREVVKGRKRREALFCAHRCERADCARRQKSDKRGYQVSVWCAEHTAEAHARIGKDPEPDGAAKVFARQPLADEWEGQTNRLRSAR